MLHDTENKSHPDSIPNIRQRAVKTESYVTDIHSPSKKKKKKKSKNVQLGVEDRGRGE